MVSVLASFMTPFMGSAVNVALPVIGKEFQMDAILLSWVATAYLLAAAAFLLPVSRFADITGRKRVFIAGIVVQSLGSLFAALAPSGRVLVACRGIQGLGSSMIFGTGMAILTSVFPANKRGHALGCNTASVYLGLSLGPVIGGFLTHYVGWRAVFFVPFPIGVAALVMIFWRLEGEWAEAKGEAFDWGGALIYGLALVALMRGFPRIQEPLGVWLVCGGLAGLGLFVVVETQSSRPLIDMGLFYSNRVFAFSNLAALLHYSATSAVGFLLSLYLQYVKGLQPQQAGLLMLCQSVMMAGFSPVAGRLSDRIEPRIVASIGMGLSLVGIAILEFLTMTTPTGFIVIPLVIQGLGFALFSSPNTNAVMGSVDRRRYGVASGTISTMRLVGMMLSMGITMLVFARTIGYEQITPERFPAFMKSMKIILGIASASCLCGVSASLARGKAHK